MNIIVGPNGSGKTILARAISQQFQSSGKKVTFIQSQNLEDNSFAKILSKNQSLRSKIELVLSNMLGKSIKFIKNGKEVIPIVINREFNVEYDISDNECHGLKTIISLLTKLYTCKTQVLIIDEPELHLHPQFQSFFMNELREFLKTNSRRIFFIITHSPFFIDLRSPEDLKGVIVCHVNRVPTSINQLSPEDEKLFRRFLPRFNSYHKQFFFSDNQIFVEGYTDQQIFTALLSTVKNSRGTAGTGVIDVGGKDELGVFFKVCALLGTNARIITDLDSLFRGKLKEEICKDERTMQWLSKKFETQLPFYRQIFDQQNIEKGITLSKLINRLELYILEVGKTLLSMEETCFNDSQTATYIEKIKALKEKYEKTDEIDTYKTVLLQGILNLTDKLKNMLPVPSARTVPLIVNLAHLIYGCLEACRVYILPAGCIEHYYSQNKVEYMPVSGKDRLFHAEYDFLCSATPKQLLSAYPVLANLLNKASRI